MSPNALILLQLVIFGLLVGATFLMVWSFAGLVAEEPEKMDRDIQEMVDKLTAAECVDPKTEPDEDDETAAA